jgi:ABC-type transport system substrate-binding protein
MGHYVNEEMDKLLDDGTLVTSFEERKKIYDRVQEIEAEESYFINLYFDAGIGVVSKRMKNVIPSNAGPVWNIVDWEVE